MKKVAVIGLSLLLIFAAITFTGCLPAGDKVAVIPLSGTITNEGLPSFLGLTITPDQVKEQLEKAKGDSAVKAIVLRIESPGGEVAPCQEILAQIEKVKEKKPVVVSMGTMAASGGYYISAKADRIVALPGTLTGSIGVIAQIPNIEGLYEKLGIKVEVFKGGKYKDMYSGLRELTPEERDIMQRMTDEYYEQFVEVVAEGRGLSKEQVRTLATGQLYTGLEAKNLGLVDELGGLDTAIDVAAELAGIETPKVEYYQPPRLTLRSLLGFADEIMFRAQRLNTEDMILLQTLNHMYPQPRFLYLS